MWKLLWINSDETMNSALQCTINIVDGQKQGLCDPDPHLHAKRQYWTLSKWREDEVQFNPTKIIDEIEKLEYELYDDLVNKRVTCPRPTQIEFKPNIITLIGLTESAKRDTGEVSSSITHNSIGTSSTSESENNTNLGAEDAGGSYARRAYSTSGQRKVVNQTAKYGMMWLDTNVSAVPINIKESGQHWDVSATSKMHSRVTFTTFTMASGDIFVTQINEAMENGSA